MPTNREKTVEKLKKENGNRWIGSPSYDCLSCSHSMSTETNELICIENQGEHKKVNEQHVCPKWI